MRFLKLNPLQMNQIVRHAQAGLPDEICGLLAGHNNIVERVIPVQNSAADPQHHYEMDPQELLRAFQYIDSQSLELLATYHSHPMSLPIPSQEDILNAERNLSSVIHLIISLSSMKPEAQAWYIKDGLVQRVELRVGADATIFFNTMTKEQTLVILFVTILAGILLVLLSLMLLPSAPVIPTPS